MKNLWIVFVSFLVTTTAWPCPLPSQENDWNVFRGNPQSTGVAATDLPETLEVVWEYKIPERNGAFEGTPLIVKDPDGSKTVYANDLDGSMYALDLDTGKLKWSKKLSISIGASPAYQDGFIYSGDIDGIIYCLDTKGDLKWKFSADAEVSSPNFYKGNLVFGSQDAHIYMINGKTGELIWKKETPDQIQCSVTVADDRAFVAGCDGFFHVVSLEDGRELGNVDIHSPTQCTPAVSGSQVFFGTEQAEFFAVDWKKIKAEWNFMDSKGQSSVRGCAAVTKEHVVFGARNRQVYSLDPITGKQNWTRLLKSKVDSSPTIVGDKVYVGATDGRFYVLSLKSGDILWEKQLKGGILASPAAAHKRVVVATDEGVVYCLGKQSASSKPQPE
ncbi:MAG: PQQ-binding-like beta-propeller repeat protein [Planctomycetota bacterium]